MAMYPVIIPIERHCIEHLGRVYCERMNASPAVVGWIIIAIFAYFAFVAVVMLLYVEREKINGVTALALCFAPFVILALWLIFI